jgi:hypothetical protein
LRDKLETEVAQLLTIERGLVARERDFFSWDDALRAAGIPTVVVDGRRASPIAPRATHR